MLMNINKLISKPYAPMEVEFFDLSDGSFKVVELERDSFRVVKRHSFFGLR